jgi:hypothetical protein|tara:strand:- start:44 stop:442 length:399 start_codon:yes stop_codon:yes gene_type:complete
MSKTQYIEPSSSDISSLKLAQEYNDDLNKKYKDKKFSDIGFNISLVIFGIGCLSFFEPDDIYVFFWSIGGVGLLFFGMFKYSNSKGDGKYNIDYSIDCRERALKEVECEWREKDDRYYVFLKDGRMIEASHY